MATAWPSGTSAGTAGMVSEPHPCQTAPSSALPFLTSRSSEQITSWQGWAGWQAFQQSGVQKYFLCRLQWLKICLSSSSGARMGRRDLYRGNGGSSHWRQQPASIFLNSPRPKWQRLEGQGARLAPYVSVSVYGSACVPCHSLHSPPHWCLCVVSMKCASIEHLPCPNALSLGMYFYNSTP